MKQPNRSQRDAAQHHRRSRAARLGRSAAVCIRGPRRAACSAAPRATRHAVIRDLSRRISAIYTPAYIEGHAPLDTQVSETYLGVSRLYIPRHILRATRHSTRRYPRHISAYLGYIYIAGASPRYIAEIYSPAPLVALSHFTAGHDVVIRP